MVRIPSEYQEVEWIESTGTQWIDSGKFWEKDDCIQISFMFPYSMTNFDKSLFGCYANGSQICELNINSKYFRFDVMTYSSFQIDAYKIYSISKDGNKWFVDGEDQNTNTYNATITTHTNILFGRWYDNSATKLIKARVYSYKQTRNNVLILNFIPCYRKSDSTPGMYDTISKTFFTNAGTGTFLVGRDVTYSTVNLLESRRRILLNTPHIESKSSLSPLSFSTDVVTDLKECRVHFSPIQEGTGTPSPENVRPITGWGGVSVTACGKNLLETQFDTFIDNGGITFSMNPDKSIHLQGTINSTGNYCIFTPYIYIKPGNYKYSKTNKNAFVQLTVFDQNGQIIQRLQLPNDILSKDITISKDSSYMDAFIRARGNIGDSVNFDCGVQIEYASIATPYEPYQGESYDIDFPSEAGTVYGGTMDVTTGLLTVTMAEVDLGTLTWRERIAGNKEWVASVPSNSITPKAGGDSSAISSMYRNLNNIGAPTEGEFILNSISISSQLKLIWIKNSNYSNAEEFRTAMSGVQLIYELATPQTYQLTPETIRTLKGINNVFSNANGNIDIKFYSH